MYNLRSSSLRAVLMIATAAAGGLISPSMEACHTTGVNSLASDHLLAYEGVHGLKLSMGIFTKKPVTKFKGCKNRMFNQAYDNNTDYPNVFEIWDNCQELANAAEKDRYKRKMVAIRARQQRVRKFQDGVQSFFGPNFMR